MTLEGKSICFTGTLQRHTRAEASQMAEAAGAKVMKSVTKNTNIVVAGGGAGAKKAEAKKKGCEVWTEDEFLEAVGSNEASTNQEPATAVAASTTPTKKKPAETGDPPDATSPPQKKARTAKATAAAAAAKPPPATPPKVQTGTGTTTKSVAAAATPGIPGSRERKVMSCVPDGSSYKVYADYDCKLMLSDQVSMNSNKFYKLQLLERDGAYYVATNWGRLGEPGQSQVKGPHDEDKGIKEFGKVFRSKTKNAWGAHPFVRYGDKYQLIETTVDDADHVASGGGGDQALGRLTEAQIEKGQAVLHKIRATLEEREKSKRAKVDRDELGNLSNEFYSLIPTQSGRQRPPMLDNMDIVTEKEGLLEFWLRMGFEELSPQDVSGSPIQGVYDLPVSKSLTVAASGIADRHSITSSQSRGKELSQRKAGEPVKDMPPELYAAILLYTGNSIYRELNRCLRVEWKGAVRYWNYLRLYFEATDCMAKKEVTLWRGIAADLYDEYEPGKIITWWTVSSCTAAKSVAENFMNQLGGSAATLLTLHTKRACDISSLSFYPHEQESLLNPGTKLRVMNRTRNGKVAEIEVEEVLEDELDDGCDADEKKPAAK